MIPPPERSPIEADDYDHLHGRWPDWDYEWRFEPREPSWSEIARRVWSWFFVVAVAVLALFGLAQLLFGLLAHPARAAAPTTSPQWVDITQHGADPTDAADSTAAINTSINLAITGGQPLYLPAGTYRVTAGIVIDYAGVSASGFRIISDGATIDGRSIAAGPVLQVKCSGGSPATPATCSYFKEQGTLFINGSTPAYVFVLGTANFADEHMDARIGHLIVANTSTAAGAGGCQFNYVENGDIFAICTTTGGAAGLAFEQTQASTVIGDGTASGIGGRSIVIENGANYSNVFDSVPMSGSPICVSITSAASVLNEFLAPYLNCVTAVSATAGSGNTLINPNYGAAVVNFGPNSTGVSVIGPSSRANWIFPATGGYTAAPVDDGLNVSPKNTPGASLSVVLPPIASVNPGWSMGFGTDTGKGLSIAVPDSANFISGGIALGTITMGPGNYEYLRLQSDGTNWRILSMSHNTQLYNAFAPPPWPSRWLYPSSTGYSATIGDNGNAISSNAAGGTLTVTLPSTTSLPNGWGMGFATDNGNGLVVQTNATNGGHIVFPGSGASVTSISMSAGYLNKVAYEYMVLQFDNNGNFRVIEATPATANGLQMLGTGGINRYRFPVASAYTATSIDNGNNISGVNSPLAFFVVTLPLSTTLNPGWSIGITSGSKVTSAQIAGGDTANILMPGTLGSVTSVTLSSLAYENAVLQFDGSNFRVSSMTPISASINGGLVPFATPSTSGATCQQGAVQVDATFVYVCTAANTWKRAALSSF